MTGLLVLVVGPSGSGKDTLLAGAAQALARDMRFHFVRRVVTRTASHEDHDVADVHDFLARRDAGEFSLHWEAHGLHYGIPQSIVDDLAQGRIVVANVSRGVLARAAEIFPISVLEITAPEAVRSARLAARNRESANDIQARLSRAIAQPDGLTRYSISNDGTVAEGVAAVVTFLLSKIEASLPRA